ncbi:unnamed protein product [Caenorhabditis angaria]|uniref:RING-type domain-containing protein n=1 Tax=Caenorhabditis angaria TaxID=860376 RepID=A0A9P1I5J3_9PELO|nr:unnamed protein product [Caenorhabditis angaria]
MSVIRYSSGTVARTGQGRIDANFSLKPSCEICSEEYNEAERVPKLLQCGHTFCLACLKRGVDTNKFSYSADAEVFRSFACFMCRAQTPLNMDRQDFGFPTNFQLMEILKPSDSRSLKCTDCLIDCNELMLQVCRDCTLERDNFDFAEIHLDENVVDPDQFAICSTCVLKKHSKHSFADFYPIRRYWIFKKILRDVNVSKATYVKCFSETREVLNKTPNLLQKLEDEATRMVEIMSRAKSSHQLKHMEKRFEDEMKRIVAASNCVKEGLRKIHCEIQNNTASLREENDNLNGNACHPSVPDILDILKVFNKTEEPIPEPVEVEIYQTETTRSAGTPFMFFLFISNIFELIWLSTSWFIGFTLGELKKIIEKHNKELKIGTTTIDPKFFIVPVFSTLIVTMLLILLKLIF